MSSETSGLTGRRAFDFQRDLGNVLGYARKLTTEPDGPLYYAAQQPLSGDMQYLGVFGEPKRVSNSSYHHESFKGWLTVYPVEIAKGEALLKKLQELVRQKCEYTKLKRKERKEARRQGLSTDSRPYRWSEFKLDELLELYQKDVSCQLYLPGFPS